MSVCTESCTFARCRERATFALVRSGERSFVVVAEWDSHEALAAARPAMIANLDKLRPILKDLGGGRGLTEPWSGEVALHMKA